MKALLREVWGMIREMVKIVIAIALMLPLIGMITHNCYRLFMWGWRFVE